MVSSPHLWHVDSVWFLSDWNMNFVYSGGSSVIIVVVSMSVVVILRQLNLKYKTNQYNCQSKPRSSSPELFVKQVDKMEELSRMVQHMMMMVKVQSRMF